MLKPKIFNQVAKQKIIYVFRINDESHKGLLKVGDTSNELVDFECDVENTIELESSASKRIDKYTKTAGIKYELLYTTIAIDNNNDAFRDYDVHRVLENSGIKKIKIAGANEWFKTDLNTVKNAIKAVKERRVSLVGSEISHDNSPIIFRDEQRDAIDLAKERFKKKDVKSVLWNAKMRFGKTLSGLQVVKESKYKKTIIITHRPVVDEGWFEDFHKIFFDTDNYQYGSKKKGTDLKSLLDDFKKRSINFVYFASIQDLRGAEKVGGKFDKNIEIFNVDWDLIIIDEAHEGTTTKLGENVIEALKKDNTKFLYLSGTPFNIQDKFDDDNVYTWDYVMEQQAKSDWEIKHPLESNPYDELPRINIYTYDLNEDIKNYFDTSDKAFNFKEFFRVYKGNIEEDRCNIPANCEVGDFIHEKDVNRFLDLMTRSDNDSNYPFSTPYYRQNFNHTLWIIPGVKEAKALSKLLKNHSIFGKFNIVNVAGDGDEDEKKDDALDKVKDAIKKYEYTITLSCGKLTTGTTIKEWSAVMYLAGSYMTSAASYLQTIFRVQTPCKSNGKIKTDCFVFDFAPDRVLRILAEATSMNIRQSNDNEKRLRLQYLINFLPVISMKGSSTKEYNVDGLLQELKKAYADRVARNGFDDSKLYNDELLKLDDLEIEKFNNLKEIIGNQTSDKHKNKITINSQGLDNAELESIEEITKEKKKRKLTKEELERLNKYLVAKKQKDTAISILRGISVRIPLLIYGMDKKYDEDINIDNFTSLVDDESFEEFMPKGVTKDLFNQFKKYYDKDVFVSAGRLIRQKLKRCDDLPVIDRILEIASIFQTFRNPDKETVLTPWKTVNMHMSSTLGGYDFNQKEENVIEFSPKFIDNGEVTKKTLCNQSAKILEINSKTGLYPLYVGYSIFKSKLKNINKKEISKEEIDSLWFKTIEENIFVLCKTQMAKTITLRTLCGYNVEKSGNTYKIKGGYSFNIHYFKDYVNQVKNKQENIVKKVLSGNYWGKGDKEMKFDAVVGNPPYQENISSAIENQSLAKQLFPWFIRFSISLKANYISLITPSRWFAGEAQDKSFLMLREFIKKMKNFNSFYIFKDATQVFPNVTIKGGVSFFLYSHIESEMVSFNIYDGNKFDKQERPLFEKDLDIILEDGKDYQIIKSIQKINNKSIIEITKGRNAFGIVGKEEVVNKISKEKEFKNCATLRCKNNEIRYIKETEVTKNQDIFNNYKVFISKSAGDPSKDKKVIGFPYLGEPKSACTDSLIPIGSFKTKKEALNLQKYLQTKFVRYLISILKVSQNVYQNVYQYVPLEDFTNSSDINWNESIENIDKQLFDKYKLSNKEIININNKVIYE